MRISQYLAAMETCHAGGLAAANLGCDDKAADFVNTLCRLSMEVAEGQYTTQQGFRTAFAVCSVADLMVLNIMCALSGDHGHHSVLARQVHDVMVQADLWAARVNYDGTLGEAERFEIERRVDEGSYCMPSLQALLRWLDGPRGREDEPGWDFAAIESQLRLLRGRAAAVRFRPAIGKIGVAHGG